jgi:hypothetical protein
MTIYVYRNSDGLQVDAIEGIDTTDCEHRAQEKWGAADFHWSFNNAPVSRPATSAPEVTKRGTGEDPLESSRKP